MKKSKYWIFDSTMDLSFFLGSVIINEKKKKVLSKKKKKVFILSLQNKGFEFQDLLQDNMGGGSGCEDWTGVIVSWLKVVSTE